MTPLSCAQCGEIINFLNPPKKPYKLGPLWFCDEFCKMQWEDEQVGWEIVGSIKSPRELEDSRDVGVVAFATNRERN